MFYRKNRTRSYRVVGLKVKSQTCGVDFKVTSLYRVAGLGVQGKSTPKSRGLRVQDNPY